MDKNISILFAIFLAIVLPFEAHGYLSSAVQEPYLSDILLREMVDRMGRDLVDAADSYIDPMQNNEIPSRLALMARASKDLEDEQMDYESLLEGNPSPSLRDQEYLQHSSLWGHQYVSGGGGEGPQHIAQQIKTDATLPAYCNPPNPCPVGFTEDQGCQIDFENTAAYSRDYQAAQDCMCDGEHMFGCPVPEQSDSQYVNSKFDNYYLNRNFDTSEHKNLVAKKFHPMKSVNPYLTGEKLPVAAKKGNHVY